MKEHYQTDIELIAWFWKKCRNLEETISELENDLRVAEEFSRKQNDIINEQEEEIPNVAGFCVYCGMHRDTFYMQREKYPDAFKKVQDLFEMAALTSRALSDTMKIFYMKNRCGYVDRVQNDVKVAGTIEQIFEQKSIAF